MEEKRKNREGKEEEAKREGRKIGRENGEGKEKRAGGRRSKDERDKDRKRKWK